MGTNATGVQMKVGVVGAGTMGSGIAQVGSFFGNQIRLVDRQQQFLDRGLATIQKSLRRIVDKKPEAERGGIYEETLGRIQSGTDLSTLSDCEIVIEAVFENFDVKSEILKTLDEICPSETILASNTSSISITRLAAVTGRAPRVIGMHFMNPVPIMKLVEIIRGLETSDETCRITEELTQSLGKVPVQANDFPGFVSNRVLLPMLNEAMFAVMEGVASPEAVDQVMKLGMNHPMGPLQLADFIGLDVCLDILNVLYDGFKDPKYRPCPLLQKMVDAGHLGRKSGRGFYAY